MSVFRAFIAIELPADIQVQLDQVTAHFKQSLPDRPVRWVPASNIHLTIKFLGDVSMANYEMLTGILTSRAEEHQAFVISVGGVGAFPNMRRPRVIWVGVEAPEELQALQRGIEGDTARLGYPPERRAFSPHLTLARVSRNATPADIRAIGDELMKYEVGFLGVARVTAIHLYRSDLKPGGAVYTRLYSAPLNET